MLVLISVLLVGLVGFLVLRRSATGKRSLLPGGPAGWPLIGNLLDLSGAPVFKKLTAWSVEYGPIYTFRILTQPIVVINNVQVAGDILDRMSAQTAGRPTFIKAGEYMSRGRMIPLISRNDVWRRLRKAVHENLNVRAIYRYRSIQEEEAALLVDGLLRHSGQLIGHHTHRFAASIGMRILYGSSSILMEDSMSGRDPSKRLAEISDQLFEAVQPPNSVVDMFPLLRHVISRSSFLRRKSDTWYAEATRHFLKLYHSEPVDSDRQCISSTIRSEKCGDGLSEMDAVWLVGSLFIAAQDTSNVVLQYFFLAMVLHPHVAKEAQKQLDAVIGNRPPTFEDQSRLPYIEAIVKEVLRWRTPTPMSVPHTVLEEFRYGVYLIPKGTMIIPNLWAMDHDATIYPDGDVFKPSRFLTTDGSIRQAPPDSHDDYLTFGHGRRVCPGRDLATKTLWISVAYVLWAFDIKKELDEHGSEVTPDENSFVDMGTVVCPAPLKIRAVPRSPDVAVHIEKVLDKGR